MSELESSCPECRKAFKEDKRGLLSLDGKWLLVYACQLHFQLLADLIFFREGFGPRLDKLTTAVENLTRGQD